MDWSCRGLPNWRGPRLNGFQQLHLLVREVGDDVVLPASLSENVDCERARGRSGIRHDLIRVGPADASGRREVGIGGLVHSQAFAHHEPENK